MNRRAFLSAFGAGLAASAGSVSAAGSPGPRSGRLHVPRYAPALTAATSGLFISGGAPIGAGKTEDHTHSPVVGLVERIDPVSLQQTFVANALFPRANHASVFVRGQLWLLGGRTNHGGAGRLLRETERIDPDSQAIWRGPDLPIPLIDLSAVHAHGKIYAFGGITRPDGAGSHASDAAFVCSSPFDQWRELPSMPVALGNCSVHLIDRQIYLVGGFDRERAHAITQVFDIDSERWSEGPSPPYPLSAHAGTTSDRHVFLFGDYEQQSSVLALDTASGRWQSLSPSFTPRRHVRAARIADTIIVAGGNQTSLAPALDVIEAYRPAELLRTQT